MRNNNEIVAHINGKDYTRKEYVKYLRENDRLELTQFFLNESQSALKLALLRQKMAERELHRGRGFKKSKKLNGWISD